MSFSLSNIPWTQKRYIWVVYSPTYEYDLDIADELRKIAEYIEINITEDTAVAG